MRLAMAAAAGGPSASGPRPGATPAPGGAGALALWRFRLVVGVRWAYWAGATHSSPPTSMLASHACAAQAPCAAHAQAGACSTHSVWTTIRHATAAAQKAPAPLLRDTHAPMAMRHPTARVGARAHGGRSLVMQHHLVAGVQQARHEAAPNAPQPDQPDLRACTGMGVRARSGRRGRRRACRDAWPIWQPVWRRRAGVHAGGCFEASGGTRGKPSRVEAAAAKTVA